MKALDLFCGLGGWSDGLALEGFEVLGVEINEEIADLYKHPVICEDVRDLDPKDFMGYDLIVGSPPCRDFSSLARMWGHRWKRPPDPEGEGMSLVNAFLNIVEMAKPRYWLMENVPNLVKYLDLKPRCKTFLGVAMLRCLWGNFPSFLIPVDMNKKKFFHNGGDRYIRRLNVKETRLSSWERAKIPLPVARALGNAVKSSELMKREKRNE